MAEDDLDLIRLARARWRVSLALTSCMLLVYFGFILLTAFHKEAMGQELMPGLSLGILLGAAVIVVTVLLTAVYIWWANAHYDPELRTIQSRVFAAGAES